MREKGAARRSAVAIAARRKKPYAKPAVVYRQPLEALATVCTGEGAKSPSEGCTLLYS